MSEWEQGRRASASFPKQLPRPNPQRVRDPVDVDEAEVIFAALDSAEVGAVEAGGEGDVLLSHLHALAELAEAGAEALLDPLLPCLIHPQLVGSLWTISLWKMIHIGVRFGVAIR